MLAIWVGEKSQVEKKDLGLRVVCEIFLPKAEPNSFMAKSSSVPFVDCGKGFESQ